MSENKSTVIKFHEIPSGGLDFEFSQATGELNAPLFDLLGDFPIYKAALHVEPMEAMVQLKGKLSGEMRQVCSRCAEDFVAPFSKSFVTAFYKSEENIKSFGAAMEDIDGSFDLEFLEGNDIDLAAVIHEQVALEIPFQPLCSENCMGLCSQCGTNLNVSPCDCAKGLPMREKFSPFEKLKSLRGD